MSEDQVTYATTDDPTAANWDGLGGYRKPTDEQVIFRAKAHLYDRGVHQLPPMAYEAIERLIWFAKGRPSDEEPSGGGYNTARPGEEASS